MKGENLRFNDTAGPILLNKMLRQARRGVGANSGGRCKVKTRMAGIGM